MTPTSDKRREVAEELRGLRRRTYYNEAIAEDIKDAIGIADPANTFREPEDVYELLADLIDPTCHNQHHRASDGCFCCSECLFLYEPTDWSACRNGFLYCPRCGARVVR